MTDARSSGRQKLLERIVTHMLDEGSTTLSLRALAAEIGSSHRMLIYHFGDRQGLTAAVVGEVESRQMQALAELARDTERTPAELSWEFWKRLSSPQLAPVERLFFLLYAQLLDAGDLDAAARLSGAWLDQVSELLVSRGIPRARARTVTRLGTAVYRGLLLDLVATGDRRAVNAAVRLYISAVFDS